MAKGGKQQTQISSCGAQRTSSSAKAQVDSRRGWRLSFQALPDTSYSQRFQAASGWSGRASLGRPCCTSAMGWGRMPRKHERWHTNFLEQHVLSARPQNSNRCSEVLQVAWSHLLRVIPESSPTDLTMDFFMNALGAVSQHAA